MGIDIDPADDEQFDIVRVLTPFTIHAEFSGTSGEQLYSASDTGTGLWMALTADEHQQLVARLHACNADPAAVILLPERGRRRRRQTPNP